LKIGQLLGKIGILAFWGFSKQNGRQKEGRRGDKNCPLSVFDSPIPTDSKTAKKSILA